MRVEEKSKRHLREESNYFLLVVKLEIVSTNIWQINVTNCVFFSTFCRMTEVPIICYMLFCQILEPI